MGGRAFSFRKVLQAAAAALGDGLPMDVTGLSQVGIQVTGITSATITWEGTIDGATWAAIQGVPLATGTAATTATANGLYRLAVAGLAQIRARISTFGTGAITVTALAIED